MRKEAAMENLLWLLIAALALVVTPGYAQDGSAGRDMQILRDKVKTEKKAVVAANMQLTDAEAKAFWPIYDAYQKGLDAMNARLVNTIVSYADAYKSGSITDQTARKLLQESIAIDDEETRLRKQYAAKLMAAIPAAKAVRFMQIDNKVRAAIRYEITANIPLLQ